ncbi:ATP-dependent helicase HrpB [Cyclobacterium lianum]|uniref:ATP-dependent helicase HrpB n=1 Tax=Cyclobacterium lianum TaxID=388280 RepID=A0A1M7QKT2_9BACT|nr:ATP-dependent helicase HrpB [Cyclobacterium lianum]SHN31894.1 ATP-dependent helicase HrpB [Cyclobacterium lianum]
MKAFPNLPILEAIPEVKQQLKKHSTLLLHAPPGAGKSTLLPLTLLDEDWLGPQKILMLEPRKLAAKSIAQRMAQLLDESPGQSVGYRVRFDSCAGPNTRIEVITEGILTRMMQQDNALEGVGMVIFDEFHERSIHADLGLALCREIQQILRPELKVLIMSATLDSKMLADQLHCPLVSSEGKEFPVTVHYRPGTDLFNLPEQVSLAAREALAEYPGDVLVFLPGQGEIKKTAKYLKERFPDIAIFTLYGQMAFGRQQAALLPHPEGKRKIVLSTAIAETSLTIEGIQIVIDGGFMRSASFNPNSSLNKLVTIPVTQDTAAQRTGRAGRLGPGHCYRLWSKASQEKLLPFRQPEIRETDLAALALELHKWGINDYHQLEWITSPPEGHWQQAISTLEHLGAIENGKITPHGLALHAIPAHPRIAHLLVYSQEIGQQTLASDLAALLEEKDPLPSSEGLDINLRIEALRRHRSTSAGYRGFDKIEKIARAYRKILDIAPSNGPVDGYMTGVLLAQAFPERIAYSRPGNQGHFQLANGKIAAMDKKDGLAQEAWIAVAQLNEGTAVGKIFLASVLSPADLKPMIKVTPRVYWDEQEETVLAVEEWKIGQLLLQKKPLKSPDKAQTTQALLDMLRKSGEKWLKFDEKVVQWQNRVMSLRVWNGTELWPDVSTGHLLKTVDQWLAPYLTDTKSAAELSRLPLDEILQSSLSYAQQQALNALAPVKLGLPSGSMVRISYFADGEPPVLAARLQELFGWRQTPKINDNKTPLLVHLLSPGFKPVQVTRDLENFWNQTYHEVRKELKRRYPRHHWPDNPWEAQAVSGIRRKK